MPDAPTQPKHGNQKGAQPRVRLGGGPFIDQGTLTTLDGWRDRGASYGELIDRLAVFAQQMGFDPVREVFAGVTDLTAYPRIEQPKKTKTAAGPKP
jgi:hypothetical protein